MILRPLAQSCQIGGMVKGRKLKTPFMADGLSRTITLIPAGGFGLLFFEPYLELIGSHVDKFIELSVLINRVFNVDLGSTYRMTVSLSLTILTGVLLKRRRL